jgi:lipoprotein-anchoring transpeptidase ErfK/SrfK
MTIWINVSNQTLYFKHYSYPVSTALNGVGQEEGSFKTPLGRHRIIEKIGEGANPYTIFRSREPTGFFAKAGDKEPRVIGRILRLDGLEEGYNKGYNQNGVCVDSYQRYIYIHAATYSIDAPKSSGCICLSPEDMIKLFEKVCEGDEVVIFVDNSK